MSPSSPPRPPTIAPPDDGRIRDEGAEPLLALFRLFKTAQLYDANNDALVVAARHGAESLRHFRDLTGRGGTYTFVRDMIFVCGQLLSAPRSTYEAASLLGEQLRRCRVTEISFHPDIDAHDLLELSRVVGPALRRGSSLLEVQLPRIALREIQVLLESSGEAVRSAKDRVLDSYASAVVVLRDFYEQVASGSTRVPRRVRRIAQRLSRLGQEGDPSFTSILGFVGSQRDVGARAVQAAMLTAAVARELQLSGVTIARLATLALTADVGRVRLTGRTEGKPSQQATRRLLGAGAIASLAAGGAEPGGQFNTVAAFELAWCEHLDVFGEPYAGGRPTLSSTRLVSMVRQLLELCAPGDGTHGCSPARALFSVAADASYPPELVGALTDAVGTLPTGTVVELEGGDWAVVRSTADASGQRVAQLIPLTAADGRALIDAPPQEVSWERLPQLVRVVDRAVDGTHIARTLFGRA